LGWRVSPSGQAAATAYVLLALIVPKLVGGQKNNMPAVLQKVWHCGTTKGKLVILNRLIQHQDQ
jgi:hypothetical protein